MSTSDGKVVIEVLLKTDKLKSELSQLKGAFSGLDGVSGLFGGISNSINTFSTVFKTLSGVVGPVAAGVVAGVATITTAFVKLYDAGKKNFFENLENISQKLQPIVDAVQNAVGTILDTFSQVADFDFNFSTQIADAIEFESSMARVGAIMGVVGEDISKLESITRQYGATTRYTSTQVSEAFSFMGMAGFSLNESLASIQDVLNLTTISAGELGRISDIVTDGLTALNMSASQSGNFADYLAATVTRSNTTVELIGDTMKYAGSVAGTLGVSMDDLSVAIGLMANSSVKGSRAGTSLRTLMANLSAPTDTVAKAMDKYGISLITAEDGSVDLDKTLRNLRKSLKGLPLIEQAAACKNLSGKTGMTGLMAIVNATDDAYNSLTKNVQNSTQGVAYWNQNLAEMGVTGTKCSKVIDSFKDVLRETEYLGAAFNMTTQDMSLAIQVLGSDTKITTKNMEDLFNVLGVMKDPTKSQKKAMKELGLTYKEINDDAFDYSKTVDKINSNDIGIADDDKGLKNLISKQEVINKLSKDMTLEEANKALKEYGITAESCSTGQIDLIANLKQLRTAFKDMDQDQRKASLSSLGLSDSLDEINEICGLSDKEFDTYCENLKLTTGLSEKMAQAMDETTKNHLLKLSSALQDVAIEGFNFLKPAIDSTSDALTEFFSTWRAGNKSGVGKDGDSLYTFANFKLALDNLLTTIKNADISGAIGTAINRAVTFITQGGLSGILNIGTEIIHQICQGIIQNEDGINKGISSAIKQIAIFVKTNAPEIEKAGKIILGAIRDGIKNNKNDIHDALDAVAGAMNSWIDTSSEIDGLTGNFSDIFIDSLIENIESRVKGRATELWNAVLGVFGNNDNPLNGLVNSLFSSNSLMGGFFGAGKNIFNALKEGVQHLFSSNEIFAAEVDSSKKTNTNKSSTKKPSQIESKLSTMDASEIKALESQLASLQSTAQSVSSSISQSFTTIQNTMRTSLVGCANIARNQFLSISNIVRNQITSARNVLTTQMISISNVTRTQATAARNSFTTQMISLNKVARTQITAARNVVTSQMISMRKVIVTQITSARNTFTSQMISMKNVARNQSNAIGEAIATGMTAGIRNGTASAVSAARDMVNQINAVMKTTAKINSPSKITTEYGEYLDEGWVVGVKNKANDVYKAVQGVTKEMTSRMKASVQGEMAQFALNTSSNSNINVSNQLKIDRNSINELASIVSDNIQQLKDRPIHVEAMMDKTKVVDIVHSDIRKKNNLTEKRLNRLKGVT